jgi:hypothetical protein
LSAAKVENEEENIRKLRFPEIGAACSKMMEGLEIELVLN